MLRFSIFPLPGLYFLELIVMCGAVIFSVFSDRNEKPYDWGIMTWVATGIFLSFSLLGALTVGVFFLPSTFLLFLLGVLSDVRQRRNLLIHLGVGLLAGVIQAIIMLTLLSVVWVEFNTILSTHKASQHSLAAHIADGVASGILVFKIDKIVRVFGQCGS